ncbi:AAA family ATPase, partial [Streptomyces sp. NPDC001904]|uniref:AAA family ATPase n=1 Tax=Streptomyces sp. NPDC001904 TaxID=3154531 RepID=UPI003316A233
MRLHTLHITAFGPFGGSQEVDFDALSSAGLFLLHGPTGAGKTSVLDAVCYALYGSVPGARQSAGGQGQNLRSDHAEPGVRTEVRLDLTVAGRRLELTRQPPFARPKKRGTGFTTEKAQSWLREYDAVAGEWKDLSRSHQEIGEEITQLLGMSKDQFCQVVLLPQGDFARFLRADAEARGKLLGRLFDTRRFAAVEQRLAEDRRAAEKQVTAGDAELLADAHRMQQAAGDVVETAPVDAAPGDPGVAEAVLGWAAVARSTAREHYTHTHLALGAAESASVAARRHLSDTQEADRLQRRFAQAETRAAALAEQEAELRAVRERMDRGRKAAAVAPALDLREAADAEHRDALREETRARADLRAETGTGPDAPEALKDAADAGPGALAEATRRVAQELGGLDAARRAERRLAALGRERADLDREERADTELLDEAEQWLARWDTRRTELQDGVDRAQEATARAEHLAGQLEPALRQARAARERDRLAEQADTARADTLRAREESAHAREHWLDLKEQRLLGIAAELAEELRDGTPCAVCGATEHPAPQRKSAGHVDRAAEEAALAAHRAAEDRHTEAERRSAVVREELAAAKAAAGDAPAAELADAARALQDRHAEARAEASALHAARETLAQALSEHERRLATRQEAATRSAGRASTREALEREQTSLEGELTQARGTAVSVEARAAQLERLVDVLGAAADAARAVEDTAQRLKDADARLADAAFKAGFDTPEARPNWAPPSRSTSASPSAISAPTTSRCRWSPAG